MPGAAVGQELPSKHLEDGQLMLFLSLLTENVQMLNMAKIAWGFDLSPGPDPVNVDVSTAYSDGFLIAPEKFPIRIAPRSDKHGDIITKEYESVKPFLKKYE